MKTDVIIIGSGVAGLTFAIKLAEARPDVSILIITKEDINISNTAQAQGGIAVVLDKIQDSFELHIQDTLKAGRHLNDSRVVETVISQAPARLLELIDWGTSFDTNKSGEFQLGLEGGHSRRRIVHHRDLTGLEIQRKLVSHARVFKNISFIDHLFVTDLEKDQSKGKCTGVKVLDRKTGQLLKIAAKVTFLATGGSGVIFGHTTNPSVATGDGVAMAWRAGAKIKNMNFIQFHPTALYEERKHPLFLISEAVRGFGAYLVNHKGNRFLYKTDPRGELATRDVVSDAIVEELKSSGEKNVFLDCRHLDYRVFTKEFPTIVSYCANLGIDIRTDLIPVVPAAHYQCGGIQVDQQARTSIRNLYASGECAHTGLHGANRLASNSLLEALVYSHEASKAVIEEIASIKDPEVKKQNLLLRTEDEGDEEIILSLRIRLNEIMTYDLLQSASKREKMEAVERLQDMQDILENYPPFNSGTVPFYELRNMVQTAILILKDAIDSKNSKKNIPQIYF